jgi:hypothetical protein
MDEYKNIHEDADEESEGDAKSEEESEGDADCGIDTLDV